MQQTFFFLVTRAAFYYALPLQLFYLIWLFRDLSLSLSLTPLRNPFSVLISSRRENAIVWLFVNGMCGEKRNKFFSEFLEVGIRYVDFLRFYKGRLNLSVG